MDVESRETITAAIEQAREVGHELIGAATDALNKEITSALGDLQQLVDGAIANFAKWLTAFCDGREIVIAVRQREVSKAPPRGK